MTFKRLPIREKIQPIPATFHMFACKSLILLAFLISSSSKASGIKVNFISCFVSDIMCFIQSYSSLQSICASFVPSLFPHPCDSSSSPQGFPPSLASFFLPISSFFVALRSSFIVHFVCSSSLLGIFHPQNSPFNF